MVSTISSDFGSSSLRSPPKLVPSNSSSTLRRYVVSTRGIPRPVDKKASDWLRPASAPRSFRYETLATPVNLCNRKAETRTLASASDVSADESSSPGDVVDDLTRTLETLHVANNAFYEQHAADALVNQTAAAAAAAPQISTSVIPHESSFESVEKIVDCNKSDLMLIEEKKLSSQTREKTRGLIHWSDDVRSATAPRVTTSRSRDSNRVISPNQRVPVNIGLQRPLQRGRLFHGRPVPTQTPPSAGSTLALGSTSLSSRSLVTWTPNAALSPTARTSLRSLSAGRNVVNTASRPLSLTLFQTHRSKAPAALVNWRPMIDANVKEEEHFGLVVVGHSLNAAKMGVGDDVTRHVTSSTMLALPPSLNYLLEVANQKGTYDGNERLAPSSGGTVNNSRSIAFDHVTSSSTAGRGDIRFDGK